MERFKDNARLFAWLEWLGLACAVGSFFALLLFNAWCLPLALVATGLSLWLVWKRPTSVGCLALVIAIGVGLVGISFFVILVLSFANGGI